VLAAAAQLPDGESLAADPPSARAGALRDLRAGVPELWHSVIDFDRCINCLQCAEFCLFGVYDIRPDGTPYVADPDKCKPGCPACSRVCPAAAIIFPRYHARGPIAGADEGRPQQVDGQAARQAAGPDVQAYRAQHGLDQPVQLGLAGTRPTAASAQDASPPVAPARDETSVDAMIRELEGFDA
jgi:NAD-dependent dihydropyrimidine dehydrogenase PreA subunit